MKSDVWYGQKANPRTSIDRSDQGRLTVPLVTYHSNNRHNTLTTEDGEIPHLSFCRLFVFFFLPTHENICAANTIFRIASGVFRMANFRFGGCAAIFALRIPCCVLRMTYFV